MSYNSLATQSRDQQLLERVDACVHQEALENQAVYETKYAENVRAGIGNTSVLMWSVCVASETEYAYALTASHENPGGDESVIPDAVILSAVQANWPLAPT